jgi:cell division protein FtsL
MKKETKQQRIERVAREFSKKHPQRFTLGDWVLFIAFIIVFAGLVVTLITSNQGGLYYPF